MKTTITLERYELKINSLIKKIQEIERTLCGRSGFKGSSEKNPQKIEEATLKLKEARKILNDAIGLLVNVAYPKISVVTHFESKSPAISSTDQR